MEPTYHNMRIVLINELCEDFSRGDVVAFYCDELESVLVKRIVALPGDNVCIVNGTLMVNGTISEDFPEEGAFKFAGILSENVRLGAEKYIVIGDNVSESKDSRYEFVGIVSKGDIIGKIIPNRPKKSKSKITA